MLRNTLKALLLIVLLIVAAGSIVYWRIAGIGEGGIESWIGAQVQSAVNSRGDLVLKFSSVDFQAPNRVVLENLTLAQPPLPDSGETKPLTLVEVRRAQIDLGEFPKRGQPLVISSVELTGPTVHVDAFVAMAQRPPRPSATTRPKRELSAVLKLIHVGVHEGTLAYDDASGQPPVTWSNLDATLDLDSPATSTDQWHRTTLAIDESPLLKVDLKTELNLDQAAVRNMSLNVESDIGNPDALRFLAPRAQELARKLELRGRAQISLSGDASVKDLNAAALDATVKLADGHVTLGSYQFPLDQLALNASLRNGVAAIDQCDVDAIGGKLSGNASVKLARDRAVNGQIVARQLDLKTLMRDASNTNKKIGGKCDAHVLVHTTVPQLMLFRQKEWPGICWGSGFVRVTQGRLVNLPIIGELIAITRRATSIVMGGEIYRDTFESTFMLRGSAVDARELIYFGDLIAARGRGTISFDGDVNLIVNAGPLENVQQRLGAVGRFFGNISDKLLGYRVTGKLSSPRVMPLIGGG